MISKTLASQLRLAVVSAAVFAVSSTSGIASAASMFVFGDSLSDTGNNRAVIASQVTGAGGTYTPTPATAITSNFYIPSIPYASGTYSNGSVWSDYFAARINAPGAALGSLEGGTNFAFGGARVGPEGAGFPFSLRDQVNQYLGATRGVADANALYVVAGGGNNARDAVDAAFAAFTSGIDPSAGIGAAATAYAADVGAMVTQLRTAGATHIVVWNTPNLGATPAAISSGAAAVGLSRSVSGAFNQALGVALAGSSVSIFDVFGVSTRIPSSSGITDFTNACVTGVCTDAGTYAFWDAIHPTTAAHRVISDLLYGQIPVPGVALLFGIGLLAMGAVRRRV
jgi:outer membrane lipase/esterase